ncbi:3'-5' exonuclease [Xanthobacter flavus]
MGVFEAISMPGGEELEEERPLFYVAMTRAQDALHLVTPKRLFLHGQQA